jgi:protein-tyrosine-phosphatase
MKRILFVCLGNICRSPAAEAILRAKAAGAGSNSPSNRRARAAGIRAIRRTRA